MQEIKFIEVKNELEKVINAEGIKCTGIYVYSFYNKTQNNNKLGDTRKFSFSIEGLNNAIALYNQIIKELHLQYVSIGIDYSESNLNNLGGAKDLFSYSHYKKAV